jgi:hypothetical protein
MLNIQNLTASQIVAAPRKWAVCDIDDRCSFFINNDTQVGTYESEQEAAKEILEAYVDNLENKLLEIRAVLESGDHDSFLRNNEGDSVEICDCVVGVVIGPCGNAFTEDGEYIPFDS